MVKLVFRWVVDFDVLEFEVVVFFAIRTLALLS